MLRIVGLTISLVGLEWTQHCGYKELVPTCRWLQSTGNLQS